MRSTAPHPSLDPPLEPTLVVLHVVPRLCRGSGVALHHVVVHQGGSTEQTEAARAAQHTAQDVFRGLL